MHVRVHSACFAKSVAKETSDAANRSVAQRLNCWNMANKRYEAGAPLPSLEAIKKIAQVLRVTTDFLIFEEGELAPDTSLALQFQAIASMPEPQQAVIRQLLEGIIIKYEAERWSSRNK